MAKEGSGDCQQAGTGALVNQAPAGLGPDGLRSPIAFKRGQLIEYTYAAGAVTPGKVVRLYTAKEIQQHARSHGEKAAADLPNWIVCELTDAHGSYKGACHVSQLRVIGNA